MSDFIFEDYSVIIKNIMHDKATAFLEEAGSEIEAQAARNTKVKTGATKRSWQHSVDEAAGECSIGSNYDNAIWEEFGTGIYAVNGNGRKTPWIWTDEKGKTHKTVGKRPRRMLFSAFKQTKKTVEALAKAKFGEIK
ncbi:MAG: HK97 gp10 family phage protein [Candidatus Fimenecus sp.]